MQHVRKKTRPGGTRQRILLLLAALLLLISVSAAALLLAREPAKLPAAPDDAALSLYDRSPSDLASVTIRRGSEAAWTAIPHAKTGVTIQGDSITLTWEECADFLQAACSLTADAILTENAADYQEHLADYGLAEPRYEARILFRDGTEKHLRVGDKGHDGAWRYLLVDGDNKLYALSNGAVEALFVNRETLRKVTQPPLHKARIDRITLTTPDSVLQWTLDGKITDADALDRWRISSPISYPADATAMSKLLSGIASLHLTAYVCPATEENLARCGFDSPRLTIEVHMAAGTIAATNAEGAAQPKDYPAATLTYVIGGERSDMVDYVRFGNDIYISSHFTLGVFMDYDATATMSRYPVMTALGNLASLRIREGETITEYVLTRQERVAPNNELVTDDDGHPIYDVAVSCNGEPVDYAAFEAAYNALTLVTVSGTLPDGETAHAAPHTAYTFTDVDGTVHTVELASFDALHDAVLVDGHQAFYLIKGGFKLIME